MMTAGYTWSMMELLAVVGMNSVLKELVLMSGNFWILIYTDTSNTEDCKWALGLCSDIYITNRDRRVANLFSYYTPEKSTEDLQLNLYCSNYYGNRVGSVFDQDSRRTEAIPGIWEEQMRLVC